MSLEDYSCFSNQAMLRRFDHYMVRTKVAYRSKRSSFVLNIDMGVQFQIEQLNHTVRAVYFDQRFRNYTNNSLPPMVDKHC